METIGKRIQSPDPKIAHLDELDSVRGIIKGVYVQIGVAVLRQEREYGVSGAYVSAGGNQDDSERGGVALETYHSPLPRRCDVLPAGRLLI